MKIFRVLLLTVLGAALSDCSSVTDSLRHGFYVNSSSVAEGSHTTTATLLGYRLAIPF